MPVQGVEQQILLPAPHDSDGEILRSVPDGVGAEVAVRVNHSLADEVGGVGQHERSKLAKTHDGLQQILVGIKMHLVAENGHTDAGKVLQLVDEALHLSRSLAHELGPPGLYDSPLPDALQWLKRSLRETHQLVVEVDVADDFPALAEDARHLLFYTVRELLLNVARHNGTETVCVALQATPDGHVEVEVCGSHHDADLPEGENDPHELNGKGLAGVGQRVAALGGKLRVRRTPRESTNIAVTLPTAARKSGTLVFEDDSPSPIPAERGRIEAASRADCIRVLIVDDHQLMREALVTVLQLEKDIEVAGEAVDGEHACELVERLRPDVVIMDVNMPRLDGIAATRRIKQTYPHIKVIGLSLHEEQDKTQAMIEAGAAAYIRKGRPPEMLLKAIRTQAR